MHRLVVARPPDARELSELTSTLKDLTAHYTAQPGAAKELLETGTTRPDPHYGPAELAAWTMIANVILNLDEAISKG